MRFKSGSDAKVQLSLDNGHTVIVPPEGVDLPAAFQREAIAAGCVPENAGTPKAEDSGDFDRRKAIGDAIQHMLDTDEEGAFTTSGNPSVSKVSELVDFKAGKAEVLDVWEAIKADL